VERHEQVEKSLQSFKGISNKALWFKPTSHAFGRGPGGLT